MATNSWFRQSYGLCYFINDTVYSIVLLIIYSLGVNASNLGKFTCNKCKTFLLLQGQFAHMLETKKR